MDERDGRRVGRRTLITGISSIGLGTLLTACTSDMPTITTSTGETIAPQATMSTDLTKLFTGANTCTLTATTTQGPYYFDADRIRSDIRENKAGTRLRIVIRVQDSEACTPLRNAVVEIWHCDAGGLYSGAESLSATAGGERTPSGGAVPPMPSRMPGPQPSGGTPAAGGHSGPAGGGPGGDDQSAADLKTTDDKRYLRGAQVTNADGIVQFTTIWPGWYRGRTVHVHAMVHVNDARVLTTQMMFDDRLNDRIFAAAPYTSHTGRDTTNQIDSVYNDSMLLKITQDGDGWLGVITFVTDSDRDGS